MRTRVATQWRPRPSSSSAASLLLCFWSCASVVAEHGQHCASKPHCDIGGRNLSSSTTVTDSECCGLCNSTAGCAAAVWLKSVKTCFLKASASDIRVIPDGGKCFFPRQVPPPPPPPAPRPPGGMIYNCTTQGLGRKCTAVGAGGTFANSSCGGGCTMPAPPARQWPPSPPPPAGAARPNILFILSDDLGFNDVSLHGSPQIPTPHIDGLARAGLTLLNYHANPSCSPTRASILTGRHMIHHGIFGPFRIGFAGALDTAFTLLPQYLQRLGMQTHAVGKWHLGFGQRSQLPRARGFDSYLGYWNGAEAYSNHTVGIETTNGQPSPVYDFIDETGARPTTQSAYAAAGQYSTHVFTARAVDIIKTAAAAPTRVPWFVYLAYQSVHWPLEAPASTVAKFAKIPDKNRQLVAAMASEMDTGVGEIVASLKATGAYNSTLIIFTSDNGGPTNGFEGTQSNNYPLRGGKKTMWEGGSRVVGLISGFGITPAPQSAGGRVSYELVYCADWLPTLVGLAIGPAGAGVGRAGSHEIEAWRQMIPANEPAFFPDLGDGVDVWHLLSGENHTSPRTELLVETHATKDTKNGLGDALTVGRWKIIRQNYELNTMWELEQGWFPPPGQDANTTSYVLACGHEPPPTGTHSMCNSSTDFCLFDVGGADPCEHHDVAAQHPDIVQRLVTRLAAYQATVQEQICGRAAAVDLEGSNEAGQKLCGCWPQMVPDGGLSAGGWSWAPCDVHVGPASPPSSVEEDAVHE